MNPIRLLAQATPDPIGKIDPKSVPFWEKLFIDTDTGKLPGLVSFINLTLRLVFIVAGLFVFINFVIAGFDYLSAGGDPKKTEKAWTKIWQSILGIVIIIASFLIAALIGLIFFGNPSAILDPSLK